MTHTTPNMNLVLPDVLGTVGPSYAYDWNAAGSLIDSHDHSSGKGVQVTPSGLNISSDLTFNQNNATNLRTARLYNNTSITPGVNDKTCLYSLNDELYYIDGAGNTVQITLSGGLDISGSITSLSIKDSSFFLQYFGDITKQMRFNLSAIPTATTRIISVPDSGADDTMVTQAATQTLTNKTLSGNTAVTLISGSGTLTLPTSGTVTVPNGTDTLVNLTGTQTLQNKTMGSTNTLTGARIASFTPDGSNTLTAPTITDTLVTKTSTDTLTNKTLTTPVIASINTGSVTFALPSADGTSGQVIETDGSGNLSFVTPASAAGHVAANDSNVIFTSSDNRVQFCTPTATRTYTMPSTGIVAGDTWTFYNRATAEGNYITIQGPDSVGIGISYPTGFITIVATVAAPTLGSQWLVINRQSDWISYSATIVGAGTVSNLGAVFKIAKDSIFVKAFFTTGTVSGSTATISLPSASVTLDNNKFPRNVTTASAGATYGTWSQAAASLNGNMLAFNDDLTHAYFSGPYGGTGLSTGIGSAIWNSSTNTSCQFEIPTTGA